MVVHEELWERFTICIISFFLLIFFKKPASVLVKTVSVGLAQKLVFFPSCSFLNPMCHLTPVPPHRYLGI